MTRLYTRRALWAYPGLDLTVRLAKPGDQPRIVEANLAMAAETEGLSLDRATLARGVEAVLRGEVPGRYYVAERAGEIVGQLMVTFEWSDWRCAQVWWIQSVYVWPASRGGGVYRGLYEQIRRAAGAEGAAGLRLYVDTRNTRAQAVYAALGMDGGHYRVFEQMFGAGASL